MTKNGGTLQLSYDDGDAGFYVGGGGYSYLGQNVASNTSINANAGVYLRPYHDEYRQLQTGLSMSYMDYSKNLSYFTYGQGGYFSPQNYVSVSLPVSLTEKYDNWTMKLGGSVGYQSYSQDKSAYFPTQFGVAADPGDGGEQWVCQGSLLFRDLEERHRLYPARRGGLQG
ncbi:putative cellulose synthase [Klebsiella variicola]|nr:putative cellulose synthase [Klebsiella variicola]